MNENENDDCDLCNHARSEHDGMGDCHHADARTATGFCAHARAVSS